MKLKNLALAVVVLAALAGATAYLNRPVDNSKKQDPRVGQPLVDAKKLEDAAGLKIKDGENTIELKRGADKTWVVTSYHDLPADFSKLTKFVQSLIDTKIDRLVTKNKAKLDRLDLDKTQISFLDSDGKDLWSISLGRNADSGGRFLEYSGEQAAYLARLNAWIDTTSKNWVSSTLLDLKPDDVAKVELSFPDSSSDLVVERAKAADAFQASQGAPEGHILKAASVTSLISSLTGLRFSDTTDLDAPDAASAREHSKTVKLTTFDGRTVTLQIGRRPEEKTETTDTAKTEVTKTDNTKESNADTTAKPQTKPAGPVYVFVEDTAGTAPALRILKQRACQVYEYTYNQLPKSVDDWFETAAKPAPSQPAAKATSALSSPTKPKHEPITVTTPPLGISDIKSDTGK